MGPIPPPLIRSSGSGVNARQFSSNFTLVPSIFPAVRVTLKDSTGELKEIAVDDTFFLGLFQRHISAESSFGASNPAVGTSNAAVVLKDAERFVFRVKCAMDRLVESSRVGPPVLLEFGILRRKAGSGKDVVGEGGSRGGIHANFLF